MSKISHLELSSNKLQQSCSNIAERGEATFRLLVWGGILILIELVTHPSHSFCQSPPEGSIHKGEKESWKMRRYSMSHASYYSLVEEICDPSSPDSSSLHRMSSTLPSQKNHE